MTGFPQKKNGCFALPFTEMVEASCMSPTLTTELGDDLLSFLTDEFGSEFFERLDNAITKKSNDSTNDGDLAWFYFALTWHFNISGMIFLQK